MGFGCLPTMSTTGKFHMLGAEDTRDLLLKSANGITECPIPPGASKVYMFKAEQYGSSW